MHRGQRRGSDSKTLLRNARDGIRLHGKPSLRHDRALAPAIVVQIQVTPARLLICGSRWLPAVRRRITEVAAHTAGLAAADIAAQAPLTAGLAAADIAAQAPLTAGPAAADIAAQAPLTAGPAAAGFTEAAVAAGRVEAVVRIQPRRTAVAEDRIGKS